MMTSRVLSRLLPVAEGDVSVYESLRREPIRYRDLEAQQPPAVHHPFHDDDDDPEALLYEGQQEPNPSDAATESPEMKPALKWLDRPPKRRPEEDDDVPESLLLEPKGRAGRSRAASKGGPRSTQSRTEAQWRAAQEPHGLDATPPRSSRPTTARSRSAAGIVTHAEPNPAADAMWMYTNASNLDAFLLEIYQYYVQHGVWSVLLSRVISLATELFVFSFAMFLSTCIDYSKVPGSKSTSEVLIPQCMSKASWLKNALLFFFVIYWLARLARYISDTRKLFRMHDFYLHVLGISDQDIQTVSWVHVVDGLVKVQNANIATANPHPKVRNYLQYSKPQQRMNAESVANRLMRQDNYYVALYNKDILDFTLPIPFVGNRQFYSKSLEWCIDFCFTNLIFDEQGSIRPFCLDVKNRKNLVQNLQQRLQFMALTSVVIAPINILRFCVTYFFRYYTEFSRNPARVSMRTFTPFAEWKIREFNELDHLFQRRLRQANPFANDYLKQFPKDKIDQAWRFVAFLSGAIASVLALATLFDPELFLGFEVTPGRTAVFWLTIMIGIFGMAHGSLPDENEVHDPVLHLKEVLMYTHYMPAYWRDRLHSNEVRAEFSAMYQMKVLIFVEEILSLVVAPIILLRNASTRCDRIIDFFREHTVHVDGIGYQCNFAVFGFKKDPNAEDPTTVLNEPDGLRDDYFGLKDDKMSASRQNFMQYYSHYNHRQGGRHQRWQPPPAWPPLLSPPALADGPDAGIARPGASGRPSSARRSGILDGRTQRAGLTHRSPRSIAHSVKDRKVAAGRSEAFEAKSAVLNPGSQDPSESKMIGQDSELQDYDYQGPGRSREDMQETDTDGDEDPTKAAGVLGMLAQMKAKAEKGTGVNI